MLVKEILSALIMIFILIIPGFFFGKKRIIDEHQSQGISALAVNLTWPCLVIDAMQLKFSMQTLRDSAYMMGIALLVFGAILVISFPLAKLLRLPKTKQYVMLFMLLFGNTGFIGIPVIKALYGSEAVFYAAILEMINDLLMFTIGILLMQMSAGSKLKIRAKDFLSPGLIGVLIGLALFLADFQLPSVLGGAVQMIGNATTPLTMFLIGYQLSGLHLQEVLGEWQVYLVSLLKLLLVPVITLIFVKLFSGELSMLEKVLTISFAMPAASATVIFSQQYKGEVEFSTKTVLLSTLISLVTIPVFAILLGAM